jgi:hypothetical protein
MNEGVAWFPKILSFYSKYLVDCILLSNLAHYCTVKKMKVKNNVNKFNKSCHRIARNYYYNTNLLLGGSRKANNKWWF